MVPEKIYYTFTNLATDVDYLYGLIDDSRFIPDVIVGLSRGGLIPAVMLSHKFGIPLIPLKWSTRDHIGTQSLDVLDQYDSILIVDDICDSGKTLTSLCECDKFAEKGNFKVATLHYNTKQSFNVNYFVNAIDRDKDDRWIVYPWEIL